MSVGDRYSAIAPWIVITIGLGLIAGLSATYFYSKGFQRAHQQYRASIDLDDAAEHAHSKCAAMPSTSEALICYRSIYEANADKRRAEDNLSVQREMADWAEGMLWVTGIVGVLSVGITGVGVYWVKETLTATTNAVAEAKRGADAAFDAVQVTSETANRQLRAYVCLQTAELVEPEVRTGFSATLTFTNFGQTPAHDVRIRCREVTIRPDAIRPQMLDFNDIKETEPVVIGPGAAFSKGIHNILDEDELTAIQKEEFVIWVYGDVRYTDVFKRTRSTTFCLRVWRFRQPSERIGPCEFGNVST